MSAGNPKRSQELEQDWHRNLRVAEEQYALAVAEFKKILERFQEGDMVPPDGSQAVRNARLQECAAREEYMRILQIVNHLTVRGIAPEQ